MPHINIELWLNTKKDIINKTTVKEKRKLIKAGVQCIGKNLKLVGRFVAERTKSRFKKRDRANNCNEDRCRTRLGKTLFK